MSIESVEAKVTPAPLRLRYAWVIHTEVAEIKEMFVKKYISGAGPDAQFADVSAGWFVSFAGSREALCFGDSRPSLQVGDKVKFTITREEP